MKKTAFTLATIVSVGLAAQSPILIESKDSTMKLGFMTQTSYEAAGSPLASLEGTSQNIFLRRMRLMWSGNIGDKFEYFVETDNGNLGKGDANGNKTNTGLIIQDAIFTYKLTDKIKLDAGFILVPLSHHSTQGATNLHSWDYSAYAFQQTAALGSSANRDTGVQVRGVVGKTRGNLEFRGGVWQGKRVAATSENPYANNSMRIAGRAQWNFFDAEGGLFMGGSYLGAKKILSVGVGHDRQDDYSATAFDVFVDWPIGQNGIMGQFNHVMWDGKTWLPSLAKQTTDFAELGYRIGSLKLSPMVRYEARKMDVPTSTPTGCDETRVGAGLAWWFKGHQNNLKVFYTRVEPTNTSIDPNGSGSNSSTLKAYDQFNVQWQLLFW